MDDFMVQTNKQTTRWAASNKEDEKEFAREQSKMAHLEDEIEQRNIVQVNQ